ncbi:MAG: lysophospholipid acyltransferase family protein [Cyclobacteriaceae bacterium]
MAKNRSSWLNRFLNKAYLIYTALVFFGIFLLFFPFYLIAILFGTHQFALSLNRYLCYLFYTFIGMKIEVENKHLLDKKTTYIFCPNHFSFLDITSMPIIPVPFKYVGKDSLSSIPIFGYYYKKIHITVDREKLKSRYATYIQSVEALKKGYSLTVFPEGGINVANTTDLSRFKEGPFRMAIETGVQLVPVTLADNWQILPDDGKFHIRWKRKSRMIVHEPIDPSKYSLDQLKEFQTEVRDTIQTELNVRNAG